ncbi:truncated transposase [Streptococcus pyogenes]|nr:truncated transposase [Streptococcus pyogenes]SQE90727.1 truncated transposase [Streptococcus pyogenes]SQF17951.1 truncated transposase [Streptococcus pyogenes]SQF35964.1 truncated transposase [Streptococcus pyogenes]
MENKPSSTPISLIVGNVSMKPIDLPKMVSIRKRSKKVMKTNKKTLGKSIEERPEYINDHSEFDIGRLI